MRPSLPSTRLLKTTTTKTKTRTQKQTSRLFSTSPNSSFQRPATETVKMSTPGIPSATAPLQTQTPVLGLNQTQGNEMKTSTTTGATGSAVGSGNPNDPSTYGISSTSTDLKTAPGVELSPRQKVLVGSVLDLFKGLPTHKKMSLWTETATFIDPLTNSRGRKQYEAQWWGLKAAFSEIEQQHHLITSSGNPITLDLKTRYKVKGIGSEKVVESVVRIFSEQGKENENEYGGKGLIEGERKEGVEMITGVEDRWNGRIPEGWVATALRNLNSVVVPAFVSVPKDDGEN